MQHTPPRSATIPTSGRVGGRGAEAPRAERPEPFFRPGAESPGRGHRGPRQGRDTVSPSASGAAISWPPGGGRGQHTHLAARRRLHLGGLAGLESGARSRSGSSGGRARSQSILPSASNSQQLSLFLSHSLTHSPSRPPAGRYLQSMKCGASRLLMRFLIASQPAYALSFSPNPPLARTQRARRHTLSDTTLSKKFMERVTFIAETHVGQDQSRFAAGLWKFCPNVRRLLES